LTFQFDMLIFTMIKNKILSSVILSLAAVVFSPSAQAQLNWGVTGTGGSGTWDGSTANWYNGSSAVAWDSTSAAFGETAGIVTVSGTQNLTGLSFTSNYNTIQGGTLNFTGATPTISGAGAGQSINSILVSSTGLTISGASKNFGGNNSSLTGVIDVASSAIVRIANNNAMGTSSDIADKINLGASSILQLNSGINLNKYIVTTGLSTIESVGNSTLSGNLSLGGTTLFQLDGNSLTLTGNAGLGSTGSTVMTMPGGTGRLILDAASGGSTAYGFFIRGSDVTVQANNDTAFGTAANINLGDAAGKGTLALNSVTIANNAFLAGAASTRTIENMSAESSTYSGQVFLGDFSTILRSTTTGTLNISGNLRDDAGTAAIEIGTSTSVNSGTVNLSRASGNTYDGTTTVNSGTLLVSNTTGSATGTGAVSVGSGAKLAGTGIIAGTLSVNGVVAAGNNSTGTLTVDNAVTWNGATSASAATDWQFNLGAANTSDLLNITGGSGNLLKGTGSVFRFDFQNSLNEGTFVLINWAGTTDFSYTDFSFTNLGAGNDGTFAMNGSQLEFTATAAVPEPSALSLLLGGALLLGIFKMRRQSPHPVI
jgi:autotransporter-associated beta strand protein